MKFKEQVLESILEASGLQPEDKGNYFKISCPSCGHREAFVYKNSSLMVCSRQSKCGYHNDVMSYIKEDGTLTKEVMKAIGAPVSKKEEVEVKAKIDLPQGLTFFSDNPTSIASNRALAYLTGRGLSQETINKLGYVYQPGSDFMELGIFIPFYENDDLVYYICRNTNDNDKKHRYNVPTGINGSEYLYNYDCMEEGGTTCIFEGTFDAMSVSNAVGTAMLTSSLSKAQASKIYDSAPANIIMVPDNDDAGSRSLSKNLETLIMYKPPSLSTKLYVYEIPDNYKDFNKYLQETGASEIRIENCITYSNYRRRVVFKRKASF